MEEGKVEADIYGLIYSISGRRHLPFTRYELATLSIDIRYCSTELARSPFGESYGSLYVSHNVLLISCDKLH